MTDAFETGDRVQTRRADPPHHTRLPRYARGAVGTIVDQQGCHPLADDRARDLPGESQPVYTVRFTARELFGAWDHAVTVDLWHSYLRPADTDPADDRSDAPADSAARALAVPQATTPWATSLAMNGKTIDER